MRRSIVCLALLCFCILSFHANAEEKKSFWAKSSDVIVIDGDTLFVQGKVVQLTGIDAPEIGQQCDHNGHLWSCGMTAALDLHKSLAMARLSQLHCWVNGKTSVWVSATCYVEEKDLAAAMLGAGTVEIDRVGSPYYRSLMQSAKEGDFGLWGSTFEQPDKWAEKARFSEDKSACIVKAGKTKKGKKVFTTPLMPTYKKFKATRMFCSDEDALLADYVPLIKISK